MSTHIICFCGEIIKVLCGYPFYSGAMIEELENAVKEATIFVRK